MSAAAFNRVRPRQELRGSGRWDDEPRYRPPADSDAPPFISLADIRRRVRGGVVETFDRLDSGRCVVERLHGVIATKPPMPGCVALAYGEEQTYACRARNACPRT